MELVAEIKTKPVKVVDGVAIYDISKYEKGVVVKVSEEEQVTRAVERKAELKEAELRSR